MPEDENAIVLNTDVIKNETDIKVGDEIILKMEGRDTTWRVVGIVRGVMTGPNAYTNYPYFARTVRNVGRAPSVQVVGERHDPESQTQLAKILEEHLENAGIQVRSTQTMGQLREQLVTNFNIIVVFLLVMAILLAVVGGMGLMGTMSINVLERIREIGVMRAIGASNGSVLQVFLVEGIFIGMISWFIGTLLAIPLGKLMSDVVGYAFMEAPLDYAFSVPGMVIWLAVVVVLAALASFLPAWNAARLTVRDVLAYE